MKSQIEEKLAICQRVVALLTGSLFCMSIVGFAEATVIVYNNYATSSLSLGGYDGRYGPIPHPDNQNITYSGRADFDIGLGGGAYPTDVRAWCHDFSMMATTQVEGFFTRIAQADASWEFAIADSEATFRMDGAVICGALSWSLQDLTLGQLIATDALGPTPGDGAIRNGTLLLGHRYRLTERVQTMGSSDESASLNFSVGTGVVFIPEPSTMALAALGAVVFVLRRSSRHESAGFPNEP
jgi:hypothetical protein